MENFSPGLYFFIFTASAEKIPENIIADFFIRYKNVQFEKDAALLLKRLGTCFCKSDSYQVLCHQGSTRGCMCFEKYVVY